MITMDSQARRVRWLMTIWEKSPLYQEIWPKGGEEQGQSLRINTETAPTWSDCLAYLRQHKNGATA